MGYGVFQADIYKWDNWIENGKYLIAYDDSEFKKLERKTIKKALDTLESNTSLKFVKYDNSTCTPERDPCSWYMKFERSKRFSANIGRNKKSGPHNIQLIVRSIDGKQKPMTEITNYYHVVHEVRSL